jgi:hypothetical protein
MITRRDRVVAAVNCRVPHIENGHGRVPGHRRATRAWSIRHDLSLYGGSYPVGFVRSQVWLPVTALRLLKVVRIESHADNIPLNCGCRAYDECSAGASPGLGKN